MHLVLLRNPRWAHNPDLERNFYRAINDVQFYYWDELDGYAFHYKGPKEVIGQFPEVVDLDGVVRLLTDLENKGHIAHAPNTTILGLQWADIYDPREPQVVALYLIPWRTVVLGEWVLGPAARMTERGTRLSVDHPRHRAALATIAHELGHAFGLEDISPAPRDRLMKWEVKTKSLFTLEDLHLSEEEKKIVRASPLIRAFPLKPDQVAALREERGTGEGLAVGLLAAGVGVAVMGALSKGR